MKNSEVNFISKLVYLAEICDDGKNWYESAANHVHNSHLKGIFYWFSRERQEFVKELMTLIESLGGVEERQKTDSMSFHSPLPLNFTENLWEIPDVLNICINGESEAARAYREVCFEECINSETKTILMKHLVSIEEAQEAAKISAALLDRNLFG